MQPANKFSSQQCKLTREEAMNLFDFLILTYPARRTAWILLNNRRGEKWNEELLDFASYSLRTMLLQLLHKQIPALSVTDVMCLSYPLRRLFDVCLLKRRKYPWKMEVKAVIFSWISYFVMEIYISRVSLVFLSIVLGESIIEPLLWMIFVFFALQPQMIFMTILLPPFVYDDEFAIQPLCASMAEYYPSYVALLSGIHYLITRLVY